MKIVALIGNPNTGKTSLFNQLTTSYAYVGNWSGVTVEKKVGKLKRQHGELIDLPGLYTLNPLTEDEAVVSNFLLYDHYSTILNIVDGSQLQRNLHLTIQLLELGKPLMIGLNMTDVAENYGTRIHSNLLERKLNVLVTPIIARTGKGCKEIEEKIRHLNGTVHQPFSLDYGPIIEAAIEKLEKNISDNSKNIRWLALQFFEGNSLVANYLESLISKEELDKLYYSVEKELRAVEGVFLHQHIYRIRNNYITSLLQDVEEKSETKIKTLTEHIDAIVAHRLWGIPIFLLTMFIVFMLTFDWLGFPLSDLLDTFLSGPFTTWVISFLGFIQATPFIEALVVDGIIAGVGGVLVFLPQIFIMYIFISFLEDSGYMARVALVMDRLMEKIGLNGKAFIPMIIGFGCNVPGVMAARTVEQPRERLLTIILMPLMSCSARLPVYALFAAAFFAKNQALVVFSLYLLGITLALILAKIFSSTLLKNAASIFVIELPPYRLPHWETLARSVWDKGKGFLKKAGTIIFAGSVIIWLLTYMGPSGLDVEMDQSFLATIGENLAPIFEPLGFGTWQAGAALLTGFMAKEVVVSTMNIIYYAPDVDTLQALMTTHYTALSAYSFMAFILLYTPCMATVATIKKETGSTKWTLISIIYSLVLAYVISFSIYQIGSLLGY